VLIATNVSQRKKAEEQLERQRQVMQRLIDLQERERQIVAYEIHDGIMQSLAAGLMHLEAYASAIPMPAGGNSDYQRSLKLLRESVAEGRRLISGLRPPILDERGVVAALEDLVSEVKQDIPDLELVTHTFFGRLAAPLEVAIFRMAQEGLANIRQHSGSKRARLELVQHGEWVRLMVRDWGCGFDPAVVQEERFGLQGIRQRARLLGTRAIIESVIGQGTVIVVDFPLLPAGADAELSKAP
jgi:signal transduction histidine kinase